MRDGLAAALDAAAEAHGLGERVGLHPRERRLIRPRARLLWILTVPWIVSFAWLGTGEGRLRDQALAELRHTGSVRFGHLTVTDHGLLAGPGLELHRGEERSLAWADLARVREFGGLQVFRHPRPGEKRGGRFGRFWFWGLIPDIAVAVAVVEDRMRDNA